MSARPSKKTKPAKLSQASLDDLFLKVEPFFGRTADDPGLEKVLKPIGKWPIPDFDSDEDFSIYDSDEAHGFCLLYEDAETVRHEVAAGKAPRTRILTGCFFYAEDVEDYKIFRGKLPHGITWSDNATSLLAKLGPPKNEIKYKPTGQLTSHRWQLGPSLLTATYSGGGTALDEVYVGIT